MTRNVRIMMISKSWDITHYYPYFKKWQVTTEMDKNNLESIYHSKWEKPRE